MKLIFGFLLISLSVYLGKIYSSKYTKIRMFYEDFFEFNRTLINKVSFSNNSILRIINEDNNDSCFYMIAKKYLIEHDNAVELDFINLDEINYLKRYLSEIGASDRNNQIKFLNTIDVEVKDKLNLAIDNEKKYKTLYIKLGFLFGLIIFVLVM